MQESSELEQKITLDGQNSHRHRVVDGELPQISLHPKVPTHDLFPEVGRSSLKSRFRSRHTHTHSLHS